MPRRYYLEDRALDDAYARFEAALVRDGGVVPLPAEPAPLAEALGRVTAAPIWANLSSPHYHAAAMDGVAVRAAETAGATESTPLRLALGRQAIWVDTGDPLPPDTDAVIMAEHVQDLGDEVEIMAAVAPCAPARRGYRGYRDGIAGKSPAAPGRPRRAGRRRAYQRAGAPPPARGD